MIPNMNKTDVYMIQREIRNIFSRSKHYKKAKEARLSKTRGKRGGKRYTCDACGKDFSPKDLQMHHSPPILEGDIAYDEIGFSEFIRRVWVDEDYLFYLCKPCHLNQHSKEEEE